MLQTLKRWFGLEASPQHGAPTTPSPEAAPASIAPTEIIEPMDAETLARALDQVWREQVEARWNDDYDREVGAMATSHAASLFRSKLGSSGASYWRVSRGLLTVMRYLDTPTTQSYEYASGASAVGSALWAVHALLREQRPYWLARPSGVPAHVQLWLDRRVDLAPSTCVRAGRSDAERVGYLIRALGDWRSDCTAWDTLRGLHQLHDGVFSGAKSSFEEVPQALEAALRASKAPLPLAALQEVIDAKREWYRPWPNENGAAVACACDFAEAVLAQCAGPIDPEPALHAARHASLWRAARANRKQRP